MQQIKDFLNFIDVIVGTFWSLTMMDILPIIFSGQITTGLLNSLSGIVNLMVALAGLIYLVFRTIHFVRMSKLHIELKREEIIEKRNANNFTKETKEQEIKRIETANFYQKWNEQFLQPKDK